MVCRPNLAREVIVSHLACKNILNEEIIYLRFKKKVAMEPPMDLFISKLIPPYCLA